MSRITYPLGEGGGKMNTGAMAAGGSTNLRDDGVRDAAADGRTRVRRDDVIFLATQLAVMVDTGVPLPDALDAIAEQAEDTGLKAMVEDVSARVKGGAEFSAVLERYPRTFGQLFVAMMRASEVSGTMGQMLQRVSEYLERERDTRKKVMGAMTYPVCMLGFCVLVLIGLLVFILPRFEKIYSGKGAILPLPTRLLMGLSNGIIHYWPFIVGGLLAAATLAWCFFRTPAGRMFLDRVRIHTPILGPMYRKACLSRSLRTMATMVSSGVSMLEGLAITSQVAGNYFYRQVWEHVAERIKEGSTIAEPLKDCRLMPRTLAQMVSAGERTGKLGVVLNRIAGFCEDDLNVSIKTVTSLIEPVMIIIMGLLVGGIAIALLLPVFSLSRVMAH